MERKGRRFSDEHEIIDFPVQREEPPEEAETEKVNKKKEKKVKEKNEKKLEKQLKEKNSKKLEKKLRKNRKPDKTPDDDKPVTGAEEEIDEPLYERREKKKGKLNKKQIIAAIVIVVLLFGIVFFAANPEKMSIESISNFIKYGVLNNDSDESFPLDIQGKSVSSGNFIRKGQDICFSSDTHTDLLNSYGKTVFSIPHAYIKPILCSSPKKTLVFNLGSTGFQIISDKKVEYTAEADDNILVGDIIDNGTYALVTQNKGYLSKLYVYNEKNEQIFAYSFADYYITSVTLNSKGDHAVLSGVSALDGVSLSCLYLLDFTSDTPVYMSEFENNIIYSVRYLNDKNVCAVGRSASYSFNTSNGEVAAYDYEGKSLTAFDINTDTDTYTVSLSGSGNGRNCSIVSFNSSGKADKSFDVEEKIIDVSSYKGRVALMTNDEVMLYSKDGKKYNSKELRSDPHAVVLYTGNKAYVLCTGYIDTIDL